MAPAEEVAARRASDLAPLSGALSASGTFTEVGERVAEQPAAACIVALGTA
jgi:hypothetical protein